MSSCSSPRVKIRAREDMLRNVGAGHLFFPVWNSDTDRETWNIVVRSSPPRRYLNTQDSAVPSHPSCSCSSSHWCQWDTATNKRLDGWRTEKVNLMFPAKSALRQMPTCFYVGMRQLLNITQLELLLLCKPIRDRRSCHVTTAKRNTYNSHVSHQISCIWVDFRLKSPSCGDDRR